MKILLTLLIVVANFVYASEKSMFFFDAVCFKSSKSDTLSRIDIYVIVPYSLITFIRNSNNNYLAEYNLTITIRDSLKQIVLDKTFSKKIVEKEQIETLGYSAKFQSFYFPFEIKEGKFSVEVKVYDKNSGMEYAKSRTTNTLNYSLFDFAMSGLMYLSDIEVYEGKYKITPYLSDNIGDFEKIFLFFEVYQKKQVYENVDFLIIILTEKGKEIYRTKRETRQISDANQIYLSFTKPPNLNEGRYFVRVLALKPSAQKDSLFKTEEILSVAERSFEITPTLLSKVLANLDKSIRQLKYVAYQSDINYIAEATNNDEKYSRFIKFWKNLDPTPSTEYNEAFEEYYQRIYYATESFRSYIEGWMTDRGMVYVVLGQPSSIQTRNDTYSNRTYEIWNYVNRTFIFVDYSGFGDFRLYSPPTFSEKYTYKN
ncbi:MAG: GWxTD domain-containing protein [Ignavibacteria bacterium]|nr:GWxTD domain-containing protein [Ignavibacteria bacterium]